MEPLVSEGDRGLAPARCRKEFPRIIPDSLLVEQWQLFEIFGGSYCAGIYGALAEQVPVIGHVLRRVILRRGGPACRGCCPVVTREGRLPVFWNGKWQATIAVPYNLS